MASIYGLKGVPEVGDTINKVDVSVSKYKLSNNNFGYDVNYWVYYESGKNSHIVGDYRDLDGKDIEGGTYSLEEFKKIVK